LDGDEVAIAQAQNALPSPTNIVAVARLFRGEGLDHEKLKTPPV
jgi:hypothetical protein